MGEPFPVDLPARVPYCTSPWERLTHPCKARRLDREVSKSVKEYFKRHYGFTYGCTDKDHFKEVWKRLGAPHWTPKELLTPKHCENIAAEFQKRLLYQGEGRKGPVRDTSTSTPISIKVGKISDALVHCTPFTTQEVDRETLRAVFLGRPDSKEALSQELWGALTGELAHLGTAPLPTTAAEARLWEVFRGNLLALLPYCVPEGDATLDIPRLEQAGDGYVCKTATYTVTKIPLSLRDGLSPMHALSFTSTDAGAPPLLSFMGTTYPGAEGFGTTVLADFTPGRSVGAAVFERSRATLDTWFTGKSSVEVFGLSLGGALSLHTFCAHHDKIARVDVYNPPGLNREEWPKGLDYSKVHIWCQKGDLVNHVGFWPEGAELSHIILQGGVKERDPLNAHARAFSGGPRVTLFTLDPKEENGWWFRRLLTLLHKLGAPFIYFPVLLLCTLRRLLFENKQPDPSPAAASA